MVGRHYYHHARAHTLQPLTTSYYSLFPSSTHRMLKVLLSSYFTIFLISYFMLNTKCAQPKKSENFKKKSKNQKKSKISKFQKKIQKIKNFKTAKFSKKSKKSKTSKTSGISKKIEKLRFQIFQVLDFQQVTGGHHLNVAKQRAGGRRPPALRRRQNSTPIGRVLFKKFKKFKNFEETFSFINFQKCQIGNLR